MADIAIIKDFYTGIGESEFVGNGEIINCDVSWRKGVVRINNLPTTSSFTFDQMPRWIVGNRSVQNQIWALGDGGTLYRGTATTNTWSTAYIPPSVAGFGQGLAVWKNYAFIARTTQLDTYGPLDGSAVINVAWQTLDSDVAWHPMLVGQDDILYIGAGRYLASVSEVSGTTFFPGTASTYSFNSQALDLPDGYRIRSMAELGKNLMIGTWAAENTVGGTINDNKIADIFPWDRVSDSFNLPLRLQENGIQAMLSINNLLYFFAGTEGKLFVTDGSSVQELTKFPQHVKDLTGNSIQVPPGAMKFHKNKIIFGLKGPGGAGHDTYPHVWSYDIKSGALLLENTIATGTATGDDVGSLYTVNRDTFLIGRTNSSAIDGVDYVPSTTRYTNYSARVVSPYVIVGTKQNPAIIHEVEVFLARPLATGQGVRLSYRTDTSASFTLIDTVDFATYGNIQNQTLPFSGTGGGNSEIQNGIQIMAELTTGASSSTSPELMHIVLR